MGFSAQIFFIPTMAHMSFSFTFHKDHSLQSVLSFLKFGKVLPKEHREDSLVGGCPTDAKRREFHRARVWERSLTQDELQVQGVL